MRVKSVDGASNMEPKWWLPTRALVMLGKEQTHIINLSYMQCLHYQHNLSLMSAIDVYDVYDVVDEVGCASQMLSVCVEGFG